MSRDSPTRADMDVGYYGDSKVIALARRLRDPLKTAAYAALYDATVRASWRAGRRLSLEESLPAWWLDPPDEPLADLVAVGLLDDGGRVVEHAWASWYLPAAERIADARVAGMVGGLMRGLGLSKEEAVAEARRRVARAELGDPQVSPSPTDQPYLPASRPSRRNMPGDSLASKPARSRPGSRARRREIQDELQEDYDARATNGHDDRDETNRRAALAAVAGGEVNPEEATRFVEFYGFTEAEIVTARAGL